MEKDGTTIDDLSAAILRVMYYRDTVTTRYLRRALSDEMDVDDSEKQNERIKYRTQQKLADLRLVNWQRRGETETGESMPNECWLSREGREFVKNNADKILRDDDDRESIEDRVSGLERELAVLTERNVDSGRVDDVYERLDDLEDRVAAVSEDMEHGPEFADDLVSRTEMLEEMDAMKQEVLHVTAQSRSEFRDNVEAELESVRGDIRGLNQSIASIKEDIRMNEKSIENVKESVKTLMSQVEPMWQWFNGESQ